MFSNNNVDALRAVLPAFQDGLTLLQQSQRICALPDLDRRRRVQSQWLSLPTGAFFLSPVGLYGLHQQARHPRNTLPFDPIHYLCRHPARETSAQGNRWWLPGS